MKNDRGPFEINYFENRSVKFENMYITLLHTGLAYFVFRVILFFANTTTGGPNNKNFSLASLSSFTWIIFVS